MMCMWFALCENPATHVACGPIGDGAFGVIPICVRCAERVGIEGEIQELDSETFQEVQP